MDLLIDKFNNLTIQQTVQEDQIDDLIDGFVNLKVNLTELKDAPDDKIYNYKQQVIEYCIKELLAKKQCCSGLITNFIPKYVF